MAVYALAVISVRDIGFTWIMLQAAQQYYQFSLHLALQGVMVAWVILYLLRSRYLKVFFAIGG